MRNAGEELTNKEKKGCGNGNKSAADKQMICFGLKA